MKHKISKNLLVLSSFFVLTSLVGAQELEPSTEHLLSEPENCTPYPMCQLGNAYQTNQELEKERSAWEKLWEELTIETKQEVPEATK